MAKRQKQKWALILGGSSGFGLASARKLAMKGYNLFIVHRTAGSKKAIVQKTFDEIKKHGVRVEHMNINAVMPENLPHIISEVEKMTGLHAINLFVYSVADGNIKALINKKKDAVLSLDDLNYTVNAMGLSFVHWSRSLFDAQLFDKEAAIVGFTTEWYNKVFPGYAAVAFAKGVLEAACRYLAVELAPHGIRTNLINAGITDTPALRAILGAENALKYTKNRNPFKRLTTPEDIANVVCLLAGNEAAWINGEIIRVDGGEQIVF